MGAKVACTAPGVYAVSLSANPDRNVGLLPDAPVSVKLVREWIERVPSFRFDGKPNPSATGVTEFIKQLWLPDESILYLGKATCLRDRLGQFATHRLGDKRPHKGGHWLKTHSNLNDLHVFFCECDSVDEAEAFEDQSLAAFRKQVSARTLKWLYNADLPIPFANGEHLRGNRKQSRITGSVLRWVDLSPKNTPPGRVFVVTYTPLVATRHGREASERHGLPPFIDGSIRREPDLANPMPAISCLCRAGKFVPRLLEGDRVL